ncbi:MAG: hypothetical protein WA637_00475 [Terriglobales bacterium]
MIPRQIPGPATVSAEDLLRLELLLGERVVTLSAVADIVSQNSGLRVHVLQLAHDTDTPDADELSLDQCIVEIGIERLRESLRQSRFWLKTN